MPTIRTLELAGSPQTMGRCHGEEFRDEIRQLAEIRLGHLAAFVHRHDPSRTVTREEVLDASRSTIDAHRAYDPAVWAEFAGVAEGAGLSHEVMLVAGGYTDMRDFVTFAGWAAGACPEEDLGECSGFLVPPARAERGMPIIGQTWDMHTDGAPFVIVVRRRPERGPRTIGLTTTGGLCLIGMNDRGVSVGNNNLIPTDARVGVHYLFTITRALACASAEEAAAAIAAAPRLSGHNYLIADARQAIDVETTARLACRTDVAGEEVFVHTNHYLDANLARFEVLHDTSSSRFRLARLAGNFAAIAGPIGMDDGWRQLSDDTRGAGAICNEDCACKHGGVSTLGTVVQCPGQGRMYLCKGGARSGERIELSF